MEWQPIETAPTNMMEVLVYVPDEWPTVFTAMCVMGKWGYSSAGRSTPFDDFFGDAPLNVEKWMPLPDPPTHLPPQPAHSAAA